MIKRVITYDMKCELCSFG